MAQVITDSKAICYQTKLVLFQRLEACKILKKLRSILLDIYFSKIYATAILEKVLMHIKINIYFTLHCILLEVNFKNFSCCVFAICMGSGLSKIQQMSNSHLRAITNYHTCTDMESTLAILSQHCSQ